MHRSSLNSSSLFQIIRWRWLVKTKFKRPIWIDSDSAGKRNTFLEVFRLFIKVFAKSSDIYSPLIINETILTHYYQYNYSSNQIYYVIIWLMNDDTCPNWGPRGGPATAIPAGIYVLIMFPWTTFCTTFLSPFSCCLIPIFDMINF